MENQCTLGFAETCENIFAEVPKNHSNHHETESELELQSESQSESHYLDFYRSKRIFHPFNVLAFNHIPRIPNADNGALKRLRIIPFKSTFDAPVEIRSRL